MVRHDPQRQIRNLSERLLVGVHRHQTGKTAGQTGLRALDLTHHAVHCRKLLGVALQQTGHAVLQGGEGVLVFGDTRGGVGAFGAQRAAAAQQGS